MFDSMSFIKSSSDWFKNLYTFFFYLPFYIYILVSSIFNATITNLTRQKKVLSNETILVTGAASGLGQHIVWKLAESFPSATYILWDINLTGLENTAAKCQLYGAFKVHIFVVDLSIKEDITNAAAKVKEKFGDVTVLLNNAGIGKPARFLDADVNLWEMEMRVNFFSQLWTIHEFLPGMIKANKGHLISTCSGLAMYRFAATGGYVASKYALRGFLETLSLEMRQYSNNANIKISVVYAGFVKTHLIKSFSWEPVYSLYEPMDPDKVAQQIVEGILEEKPEICVPWTLKSGEIVYRLFPTRFVDDLEKHILGNLTIKY